MVSKTPDQRKAEARARKVIAAENRKKSIELRRFGLTYQEIGDQLGLSHTAVRKHVMAGLDALEKMGTTDARVVRLQEVQRIERYIVIATKQAEKGNLHALDRLIKLHERQAKILGTDAPQKIAHTDPTGTREAAPRDMPTAERDARIAELEKKRRERDDGDDGE